MMTNMGITYDYIADDMQEGESFEDYGKRIHVKLLIAEVTLNEAAKEIEKAQEMIIDMVRIIAEFRNLTTQPKKPPTMTAFDLGWTASGT